jgi:hypothetical protein
VSTVAIFLNNPENADLKKHYDYTVEYKLTGFNNDFIAKFRLKPIYR